MDLEHPLVPLVSDDVATVLGMLARTGRPLSGRAIARLSNGRVSQPTVSRLLRSLDAAGLAESVPGGYVVNGDHLMFDALVRLLSVRDTLVQRIGVHTSAWPTPPVSVVLFGSTARGDSGPDSDVDVLVIRPDHVAIDDDQWAASVVDLELAVRSWTGNSCEVLDYSAEEWGERARHREPIVGAIARDGIVVDGLDISAFAASSNQ